MRSGFLLLSLLMTVMSSFAQVRKIPAAVTEAFTKQYPAAGEVKYEDNLLNVHVHFVQDSVRMIAKYDNDGKWKETERAWSYDRLSPEVKDGFMKSKYSEEWQVKETAVIYLPDGTERYRIKVEKNDLLKKYLFFDKNGRLVKDALTI